MEIKIDDEFEKLIPPLTADEYEQLEGNIVARGCRDAVVIWQETGILVDGHNRYHICKKNDIPFKVIEESFTDRDDAKAWIIKNQFGRRNLSAFQRSELAIVLKPLVEKEAKENLKTSTGGSNPQPFQKSDKAGKQPIHTDKELAKIAGVSHDTIHKTEVIKKEGTEEQVERARKGGKGNSINAIYNEVRGKEKKETPKEPPAQTGSDNDAPTDFGPDGFDDFDFPNIPLQTAEAANSPADRQNEAPDNDGQQGDKPQGSHSDDAADDVARWDETDDELIDIQSWQFHPEAIIDIEESDRKSRESLKRARDPNTEIVNTLDDVLLEMEGIRHQFTENIVNTMKSYPEVVNEKENHPQIRGILQKMKYTIEVLERRYLTD